ncbi:phosphoesterase [Thermostilla marina]
MEQERVLVVPTSVFHEVGRFQGFCSDPGPYLDELLKPEHVSFRPRAEVEQDPSWKQLIPYCIFCWQDAEGRVSVFRYTRGTGQGESRLHRKHSVGIGGHISAVDARQGDPYREGMRRELEEEVCILSDYTERCVGLINDDETPVGTVHLGIVHRFDLVEPKLEPNEAEITETGFVSVSELLANLDGFETWSQICLRGLFGR